MKELYLIAGVIPQGNDIFTTITTFVRYTDPVVLQWWAAANGYQIVAEFWSTMHRPDVDLTAEGVDG